MDDLIVKFCLDRRSWLIVIAGTLLLILFACSPLADEYVALRTERDELIRSIKLAESEVSQVGFYEQRLKGQASLLQTQQAKTVSEASLAEHRNAVVKLVRESGCQLRRLNITTPHTRHWTVDDLPLESQAHKQKRATDFELERRSVALSLVGTSQNVKRFTEKLEEQGKIMHLERLELSPSDRDGRQVELSMELWYFALRRTAAI